MNESEVIVVDSIPDAIYDSIVMKSVKYAIISLPFTVDRMSIPNEPRRAVNIAKGKLAEGLFNFFCSENNIPIDTESCSTPFWTIDKKDFIYNKKEWDIKNNFIYTKSKVYTDNYTDLPALIPNRFTGDQWSKKDHVYDSTNNIGTGVVFTFLRGSNLINGTRSKDFLQLELNNDQTSFLRSLYLTYRGKPQNQSPFDEMWFWNEMEKRGEIKFYNLIDRPYLIITAIATSEDDWIKFRDTGPFDRKCNFQKYKSPRWYVKTSKGSCNFLNGTLWTTINNATSPISSLPSFYSSHPQFLNGIKYGVLKN